MILEPSRWAPLRPPFRTLAVGLADAEELLNGSAGQGITGRWARLAAAIGHPGACTRALNQVLADLGVGLRLAQSPEGVQVVLTGGPAGYSQEVRAAQALALLVEADGWSRLKRCRRPGCFRAFPDSTNGCSRTGCHAHPARPRSTADLPGAEDRSPGGPPTPAR